MQLFLRSVTQKETAAGFPMRITYRIGCTSADRRYMAPPREIGI